jgi:hypothetical protein
LPGGTPIPTDERRRRRARRPAPTYACRGCRVIEYTAVSSQVRVIRCL